MTQRGDFDPGDIEDLISDAERHQDSFEAFLDSRAKKGDKASWQKPASDAAGNSSNGSESSTAENSATPNAPVANVRPEPNATRQAMEKPGYIESGLRRESNELPVPIVSNVEPSEESGVRETPATETETVQTLHDHPIVGQYISEITQTANVDERWMRIFLGSYKLGVEEMSVEQCIVRFHELEQAIKDIRAQQQGLKRAEGEHLSRLNSKRRAEVAEFDKQERKKYSERKVRVDSEGKPRAASGLKLDSAVKKTIDTLKGMGWEVEAIKQKLTTSGKWDPAAEAYLTGKKIPEGERTVEQAAPSKPTTKAIPNVQAIGVSASTKDTVQRLFKIGIEKDGILSQLEKRGRLDDSSRAYVEKLFAGRTESGGVK